MSEYFKGRKELVRFRYPEQGGRRHIICLAYEEWVPIHGDVLRCGATSTCRQTRRIGVKYEEKSAFEERIGTDVGTAVVGKIKAQIQNSKSQSTVWENEIVSERSVTFSSPACGRYEVAQFQLTLKTWIRTTQERWFRDALQSEHELVEHLNFYYDGSRSEHSDDSCKCDEPVDAPPRTTDVYLVDLGPISIRVPSSYTSAGFKLHFANRLVEVSRALVLGGEISVEPDWLDQSTLSLVEQPPPVVWQATFLPFSRLEAHVQAQDDFWASIKSFSSRRDSFDAGKAALDHLDDDRN